MKIVILPTDALVYLLVALIAITIWYVRRHEHLRAPWQRVARSSSGMVGLIILLAFVAVGLLDSLHFRARLPASPDAPDAPTNYAVEVTSALDVALNALREHAEKTYSAPLAMYGYAKETVVQQNGEEQRVFPRLAFGGVHLENAGAYRGDVVTRAIAGIAAGICLWLILIALFIVCYAPSRHLTIKAAWQNVWRGATDIPYRTIAFTLLPLCLFAGIAFTLSSGYHVFGTDKVGEDVLYEALKSIRTALVIGTLTTLLMIPFAILFGIAAGYFGGWIDDAIQYIYTTLNSIPGVLLVAASVLMMQVFIDRHADWFITEAQRADVKFLMLCAILGVTNWTGLCRLLRGETLKLRELDYIQAAHAFGVADMRIITRHILPNVMHVVLITVVLAFSDLVLTEAVLSYVGIGVDPSMSSFGTMINNARLEMAREPMVWWSLASAFVFMVVLVLAANLFADAVRDAFDPRVRMNK